MKFLVGMILIAAALAQESARPPLRRGVSVNMPVASHAVEMRAADEPGSTIVAITADGRLYIGTQLAEPADLRNLTAGTVFVKADSRVAYQNVLTVLDALRGKSVVLLAAPPKSAGKAGYVPPYGVPMTVPR